MTMKNKGKETRSYWCIMTARDAYSVLRLLPEAIATLSVALPPEDREVLAYLIARSLDVFPLDDQEWKYMNSNTATSCKRAHAKHIPHRLSFDCSCFECYMSFWSRWNGSPNRQLIHEAMDLFEGHVVGVGSGNKTGKNRKKIMKAREEKICGGGHCKSDNNGQDVGFGSDGVTALGYVDGHHEKRIYSCDKGKEHISYCGGPERTFIRRMLPGFMGCLAEHLWTAWRPLDTCST